MKIGLFHEIKRYFYRHYLVGMAVKKNIDKKIEERFGEDDKRKRRSD